MRMTNKIMRNNSLYNINQNKILEDKLTNQMTNQSKIVRPSDDPVVAIRALRLRSNVTSVTQYHEKNAKDADQWLNITADALKTLDDVLKNLYEQATGAANKYLTSEDLSIILEQMKSLTNEFYASGNVDYAGRYVFSGFRTDTAITFSSEDITQMKKDAVSYEIKEKVGFDDISTISYTDFSVLSNGLGSVNGGAGPTDPNDESYEQFVTNNTLYRFRLSYDNVDATAAGGTLPIKVTDKDGNEIQLVKEDTANPPTTPPTMVPIAQTFTEYANAEAAYKDIIDGKCEGIAYIPTTGELVFSEQVYKDNFKEGDSFQITYNKSEWEEGDINPVHYFQCIESKTEGGVDKKIAYNTVKEDQDIYYDVGFNQKIQVNTVTDEVFTHNVQRDMDDFYQQSMKQLKDIETVISDIEKKMESEPEDSATYQDLAAQLEGAKKADTYIRENIQKKFENQITKYQQYRDNNDLAITNNATRGSRLDLITERLSNQKATFKELQTDNEGIDITQVAVELTSAELTYQAALMATGKIMQTNLMNYI